MGIKGKQSVDEAIVAVMVQGDHHYCAFICMGLLTG